MARTVNVNSNQQEVSYINKKGEEVALGNVLVEDYQGEVQRWLFAPTPQNPWSTSDKQQKPYQLGTGSKNLTFVNPSDAQSLLVNRGFILADQYACRGGLAINSVYIMPDSWFEDSIAYDRELWSNRKHMTKVWPAVQLETNLMVGRMGVRYRLGIYRQICVNGATGKILEMPEIEFRHNNWDLDEADAQLEEANIGSIHSLPLGPEVATPKGVGAVLGLLRKYVEEPNSLQFAIMNEHLPMFSQNMVKPWVLIGYIRHLDAMLQAKPSTDNIHMLDLFNAYTSAVNERRIATASSRAAWTSFNSADSVVKATAYLASLSTLFSSN